MIFILCIGSVLLFFLVMESMDGYHKRKMLQLESQKQLALETQRFEKIKEILTDGVIDGSPKALEALGPLVEIMAEQMKGTETIERMKLEHKYRVEEIEATNEPYKLYAAQIKKAQEIYEDTGENSNDFKKILDSLREANRPFLRALDAVSAEGLPDLKAKK